jgi:hypothetical protein
VFLVGSGVSGFEAPVFFLTSGAATTTIVSAELASLGVTPGALSEGAPGSTGFSARTGVPAKSNVPNVKAIDVFFSEVTSFPTAKADRGSDPSTLTAMNCPYCHAPLTEIDYYGEVLVGCVACNRWSKPGDEKLVMELMEEDLEALRASKEKV